MRTECFNAIDLDRKTNIPNKLKWHLISCHKYIYWRVSASQKGLHIITLNDPRCSICESYSDQNFVAMRDKKIPLILWSSKTFFMDKIKIKRFASDWIKLII